MHAFFVYFYGVILPGVVITAPDVLRPL